jgi:sigma-E factor negative regulatory protein RseA
MENHMTTDSEQHDSAPQHLSSLQHLSSPQHLSALMDGELDSAALGHACALWRDDAQSRADWHAYHVIGDVLRSEDLATDPARDAAFLAAFRERLAAEPVVLAPQPLEPAGVAPRRSVAAAAGSTRWSWVAPSAVAAGFVAVAGVLMLTRAPGTPPLRDAGPSIALATPAATLGAAPQTVAASAAVGVEPQTLMATDQMIRNARLERYLDAHQQFAGSSALGVPSGFLRSATTSSAFDR